jgi:hypothetical protein
MELNLPSFLAATRERVARVGPRCWQACLPLRPIFAEQEGAMDAERKQRDPSEITVR